MFCHFDVLTVLTRGTDTWYYYTVKKKTLYLYVIRTLSAATYFSFLQVIIRLNLLKHKKCKISKFV